MRIFCCNLVSYDVVMFLERVAASVIYSVGRE